jgi:hypothetical protein
MEKHVKPKRYVGIDRFMIPVPKVISERGLERGVSGAQAKSDSLSEEERKIHHFIVKKMAVVSEPITAELVGKELGVPVDMVEKAVDKLEDMKTFLYRSDGKGIDWAYPLSLNNTGHRMTVSTGEEFFAA